MKLLFVANNLSQGGIQKSLINLLKEVSKDKKYEIDLFLFSTRSDLLKEIPSGINIIKGNYFLDLTAVSFKEVIQTKNLVNIVVRILLMILVRIVKPKKYFDLLFKLNKISKEYDYAISYFNDIPSTYFNKGATYYVLNNVNAKRKVGWIHTDIEKAKFDIKYYKNEYKDFDYIINVSEHCKRVYDKLVPEQTDKSFVINNFFSIENIKSKSLEVQDIIKKKDNNTIFITVARIDNISKRIDKIIDIARILLKENITNFTWYILGDGPDYNKIKEAVKEYNLSDYIILLGNIENPYPYMRAADLLVVTSDFEGFPMVVGESLCVRTPVLSTNYDSAEEQIKDGKNGILVNKEVNDITKEIVKILKNENIIKDLKNNLEKEKISNEITKNQFDKIFGDTDG